VRGDGRAAWNLALGVQVAGSQAAWQGFRIMLAYQALAETRSPAFVGVVAAVTAFAGLVVSVPSGRLLDRFGGARVAQGGILVSLLGMLVVLVAHNVVGLLIAAVFVGVGYINVMIAQQGMAAHAVSGRGADAAFGALFAALSIGQLVGPPLVTVAAMSASDGGAQPNTWAGLLACSLLFLVSLPAYFALRRAERAGVGPSRQPGSRPASLRTVLRNPGIVRAMLVGAAVIVTVDLSTSFIPVWAVAQHIPADVVGWLFSLRALFTIVSRVGIVRMVSVFGRKTLLIAMLALTVVALLLLPFAGVWAALPIMAAMGIGLGLPQPLTLTWMSSLAPAHARGAVFGARMTVNRFAQVTLPLLVATVAGPLGVIAVFWATGAILATAVVLVAVTPTSALNELDGEDEAGGTPRDEP